MQLAAAPDDEAAGRGRGRAGAGDPAARADPGHGGAGGSAGRARCVVPGGPGVQPNHGLHLLGDAPAAPVYAAAGSRNDCFFLATPQ